jgi:hypothetical protein
MQTIELSLEVNGEVACTASNSQPEIKEEHTLMWFKRTRLEFVYMFKEEIETIISNNDVGRSDFVDKIVRYFIAYSDKTDSGRIWGSIKSTYYVWKNHQFPKLFF